MRPARIALFLAALSLVVSLGSSLTTYRLSTQRADDLAQTARTNRVALCSIIDDSYAGALRRKEVLKAADTLLALEPSLPAGPALDAVRQVEHVFRLSGNGSAAARKALNMELRKLGCRTRVA
jgi:hypothetical protein